MTDWLLEVDAGIIGNGCQIESLDDCVAGDNVDRVEVTGTETVSFRVDKKACGTHGSALRPQGSSAQGAHPHCN
jgi:hypothetical protein